MTREQIQDAIRAVLRDQLNNKHLVAFGPEARLNEDLYLDSILMLQLFLHLELEHGLAAPEEAITREAVATVSNLVDLFAGGSTASPVQPEQATPSEGVHGEDYYDIKVHCFVSCVCAALKQAGVDHRPAYFAIWDADFDIGAADWTLRYHAPGVSHAFFRGWFQQLFGMRLTEWYDPAKPKDANLARLSDLVENRAATQHVMVMLDLFHLPERENKFNQNPFPHYLMLETTTDPTVWRVLDPDFRWEGEIAKDLLVEAIRQPTVGGGYVFDHAEARAPSDADLAAYFEACFRPDDNPLIDGVRAIVRAHLEGSDGLRLEGLTLALRELPVIAIRKYAYEHGFAWFWRALKLPDPEFQNWCDEIDALFQGLKGVHYDTMKLAQTGDRALATGLFDQLDRLNALELRIKARLGEVFELWRADRGLASPQPVRRASA